MAANDPLDRRTVPGGPGADARDIRERLRQDHEATLAEVERLRAGKDDPQSSSLLRELRRAWVIHALAEETVVYRALEGAEGRVPPDTLAGERFVEHELVEGLFEKLSRVKPGSLEWRARLQVARDLIARHIEAEHQDLFVRLERHFDAAGRAELARRFDLARDKLALLEEAKAA